MQLYFPLGTFRASVTSKIAIWELFVKLFHLYLDWLHNLTILVYARYHKTSTKESLSCRMDFICVDHDTCIWRDKTGLVIEYLSFSRSETIKWTEVFQLLLCKLYYKSAVKFNSHFSWIQLSSLCILNLHAKTNCFYAALEIMCRYQKHQK